MASLARSTANRAVHLRITPRPSNISDSREILRLISQFGEVEYFKNLKYDTLSHPTASLVIFREEKAAHECLKRSPIRFRLGPAEVEAEEQLNPQEHVRKPTSAYVASQRGRSTPSDSATGSGSSPFGMSQSRGLSTKSLPDPPHAVPTLPFLQPSPPPNERQPISRIFQLQTNPARMNFRDQIDRTEYHGRFHHDTKSAIQQDLAKRVPTTGLSCWEWRRPERPDRVVQSQRRAEMRKSLVQIWEEGRRDDEL